MGKQCCWFSFSVFLLTIALALCVQESGPCTTKRRAADDKYCDKYWQCVDGQSIQRDCPNGLVFAGDNQGIQDGCDYPWKSNYCEPPKIQINPPIRSKGCEWAYGIFKHVVPCSRYWSCWNGTATEQFCTDDLWYSDISHTCEDTDNVKDCKNNKFPEPSEDYYYDDNFEVKMYDEIPKIKITILSQNLCDRHYAFSRSCEKYWYCNKGWPRLKMCPSGLVFDRNTGKCVMPPTEHCDGPSTGPPLEDITPPTIDE